MGQRNALGYIISPFLIGIYIKKVWHFNQTSFAMVNDIFSVYLLSNDILGRFHLRANASCERSIIICGDDEL